MTVFGNLVWGDLNDRRLDSAGTWWPIAHLKSTYLLVYHLK